jgi:hypothetical protein
METVTITSRGFPILEVILDDDGQAAEMAERDEAGDVIRRWEAAPEDTSGYARPMPDDEQGGSGAFQRDAFQVDAFQTGLATIRTTASRMTLDEIQALEGSLFRYKRSESNEHEVVEALPEPVRALVRASGARWLAWAGLLLTVAWGLRAEVSMSHLERQIEELRQEFTVITQTLNDNEQEHFDRLMRELLELKRADHPPTGGGPGRIRTESAGGSGTIGKDR